MIFVSKILDPKEVMELLENNPDFWEEVSMKFYFKKRAERQHEKEVRFNIRAEKALRNYKAKQGVNDD